MTAAASSSPARSSASRVDLERQITRFTEVVDLVPTDGWDRPSPCDGWTGRDVLQHVIDTEREFLTGRGIELGPPSSDQQPARRWRDHVARLDDVLTAEVWDTGYTGFFGPTTIGSAMIDFYGFDLIVHRWDLARSVDATTVFTDAELTSLESAILLYGDAIHATGICRPGVTAPEDADRQTRLLAVTGRAV